MKTSLQNKIVAGIFAIVLMTGLYTPVQSQTVLFQDNFDPIQPGWFTNYFGTLPAAPRNQFVYYSGCGAPNNSIIGNSIGILTNTGGGYGCGYTNTYGSYSPLLFHGITGTGYSDMTMDMYFKCRGEVGFFLYDYGSLMYSFDGTTWYTIAYIYTNSTGTFALSGYALPAFLDNTDFYLGFRFVSDFSIVQNPPLVIDNLVIKGTAICPTITMSTDDDCISTTTGYGSTGTATFTADATGGDAPYTYTWSDGTVGATLSVSPTSTTSYTVTAVDANGCPSSSASVTVIVTDVRACHSGGHKVLTCHVPPGNPAGKHNICISESALAAHLVGGHGHGTCYVGPCEDPCDAFGGMSKAYTFTSDLSVQISPNPSSGAFRIDVENGVDAEFNYEVWTTTGKKVTSGNGTTYANFDLGQYAPAIYIVRVQSGDELTVHKVIKQ